MNILYISAVVCSGLLTLVMCALLWRANAREVITQREFGKLQQELAVLKGEMSAVWPRLTQSEDRITHLSERQDHLDLRDPMTQTYEPAIKLAHKGADVEELMSTCGLARGEAELIAMLHQHSVAAN